MSHLSAVDHNTLWRNTVSTLASLSSLRLSWYRIKTISGAEVFVGGFGDVERAELRESLFFGSNSVVALKKLRPSGDRPQRIRVIASLARELHVWHKLRHPNILRLEGFYFDESSLTTAWIATRWQKNGNILKYVEATNASIDTRRKLALDTARGLVYLHGLSPPVCHADVKAENTLVNDSGDAVLCDFGLARILEDVPSGLTTTSAPGCTLRYAAPELVSGDGSVHSLASDAWAWGCLLFLILTDVLPYATKDRDIAIGVALSQKLAPADLSSGSLGLDDYIRAILLSCWRPEPGNRPPMLWCQNTLSDRNFPFVDGTCLRSPNDVGIWELPATLVSTLSSLRHLRLSRFDVRAIPNTPTYEGRFVYGLRASIERSGHRPLFEEDRLAYGPTYNHAVMVKVLRAPGDWDQRINVLKALVGELKNWDKLEHNNILPLTGLYFDESSPTSSVWITTPWQENGNVTTYVKGNKLDLASRIELASDKHALEVADGLAYLHGLTPPIYHGNLDPDHILIDARGHARLGGFGFTRALKDLPNNFSTRNTANCTLRYAPPELVTRGELSRSLRGDVWAWGCVLLVIVTGLLPYADKSEDTAIRESIIRMELPADISVISAPRTVKITLKTCWAAAPGSGLDIELCRDILSGKDRFTSYIAASLDEVPSRYKREGRGWQAVSNPGSPTVHHIELQPHSKHISGSSILDVSSDGKQMVIADESRLSLYDISDSFEQTTGNASGRLNQEFVLDHSSPGVKITAVCFNAGCSLLAAGSNQGTIIIWDLTRGALLSEWRSHRNPIASISFGNSDITLKSVSVRESILVDQDKQEISTWDVATGSLVCSTPAPLECTLVRSSDHRSVVAVGPGVNQYDIVVCSTDDGSRVRARNAGTVSALTSNGSLLITALPMAWWYRSTEHRYPGHVGLAVWKLGPIPEGHDSTNVEDMDYPSVATASDGDFPSPKWPELEGSRIPGPQLNIDSLSVSSDGQLAASGSSKNSDIVVWDLEARIPVLQIRGRRVNRVRDVTFRPGSTASKGCILYSYSEGGGNTFGEKREIQLIWYTVAS